jgi:hypothetical protein
LLVSPYWLQSLLSLSLSIFREFISALKGNGINLTDTNFTELGRLCDEFDFTELAGKLSEFRFLMGFKAGEATAEAKAESESGSENADARERIAALEEKANYYCHVIAILHNEVIQFSTDF